MTNRKPLQWGSIALLAFAAACSNGKPDSSKQSVQKPAAIQPGALFRAAATGDVESVNRLISAGADLNENFGTSENQVTPLLAAIVNGHSASAYLLIHAGAKAYPLFNGYAAKDFALFLNQPRVVQALGNSQYRSKP